MKIFYNVVVVGTRRCLGVGLFWGQTDACGLEEGLRHGVAHEEHMKNTKNKSKKPRTQTQAQAHHDVPCFGALVRR